MSKVMSKNKQTGVVRFRAPLDHVSTKHAIIFVDRVMRQFAATARVEADNGMVTVTVPDDQVSATPSQLETLRSVIGKNVFLQAHQTSDGKHHHVTIEI